MGTQGCIWVLVRHSRNFLYQREKVISLKMHLKLAHRRCLILVQKWYLFMFLGLRMMDVSRLWNNIWWNSRLNCILRREFRERGTREGLSYIVDYRESMNRFSSVSICFSFIAVETHRLCETRTVVIDAGKCMNLKITTYNIVFQKVEKNNFFSRRKSQLLL